MHRIFEFCLAEKQKMNTKMQWLKCDWLSKEEICFKFSA